MSEMTTLSSDISALCERYVAALLAHPAVATVSLSAGVAPVSLDQVYLPRTVLHEVKEKQFPETASAGATREILVKRPAKLWEKLRDDRVVLIEGPAGMGKSTLSKHLVRESLTQEWRLPIWIPFHRLAASQLPLDQYLDQIYVPELGLAGAERVTDLSQSFSLGQWLHGQWRGGLGLLILDGLDEVFDPAIRSAALDRLHLEGTGRHRPVTMLTTRPFLSHQLPLTVANIELQALTPMEQDQVLEGYRSTVQLSDAEFRTLKQRVHAPFTNSELMSRPGHLVQILGFYAKYRTLPATETELLTYLLHRRLQTTGRVEPPVTPDDPSMKQRVLASVSLHLLTCRQGQLHTRAQLLALIRQVLTEHTCHHTPAFSLSQASTLLNDLVHNSGLLTRVESEGYIPQGSSHHDFTTERYHFESAVWTQLLTGTALADTETVASLNLTDTQVVEFLDKKGWDPEWEPVLRSWVAQADNPFPLFERLIDKAQDDLARHRLGTAGRCLFGLNSQWRSHEQYQRFNVQIPTEAFAVWKAEAKWETEYLCASSLRKAWMETAVGQSALLAGLRDKDVAVQGAAVLAFDGLWAGLSTAGQKALVARLWDRDLVVRLVDKSLDMPEAAGLRDKDAVARLAATKIIRLDAAQSVAGQAALVTLLQDAEWYVRWAAVKVLGALGVGLSAEAQVALARQLSRDQNKRVRQTVVEVLSGLGAGLSAEGKIALVERLADWDTTVRWMAAAAIKSWGAGLSEEAQVALVKQLGNQDRRVRQTAVELLSGLGAGLSAAGEAALVVVLQDEEEVEEVRQAAIWALGGLGTGLSTVGWEALVAGVQDRDQEVRQVAAWVLDRLEAGLSTAGQEALVAGLQDERFHVRCLAAKALGRLGTTGQEALVQRLQDQDQEVRMLAAWVLGGLGAGLSTVGQEALVAKLQDEDPHVRSMAVSVLGNLALIAELSTTGLRALVAKLGDQNEWVRLETALMLGKLGVAGQEALVAGLQDEDPRVRRSVAQALDRLRPGLSTAGKEALVAKLQDQDEEVRQVVALMLGKLGVAGQEALVAGLQDENLHVRRAAAQALDRLWPELSTARQEALVARLRDEDQEVRQVAMRACTFAQQGGLRFFPTYGRGKDWIMKRLVPKVLGRFGIEIPMPTVAVSRFVSVLSATVPFSDSCSASPRGRVSPVVIS